MTKLLQRLHDELVRRHYAADDHRGAISRSSRPSTDTPGRASIASAPTQLRRYQVYLLEERRLAVGTVVAADRARCASSVCAS